MSLDHADLWPRYYFDFERAKLEIEAWMKKREQFDPEKSKWSERKTPFDESEGSDEGND
jgi:hypothetical protein